MLVSLLTRGSNVGVLAEDKVLGLATGAVVLDPSGRAGLWSCRLLFRDDGPVPVGAAFEATLRGGGLLGEVSRDASGEATRDDETEPGDGATAWLERGDASPSGPVAPDGSLVEQTT